MGWDTVKHFPVKRIVSTLAWRNWGNNEVGTGLERALLIGLR